MTRITQEEVLRVADLARLALGGDEADRMTGQLDAILDYVAQLSALDTRDVLPTAHPLPVATPMREDVPGTPLAPEDALLNAPAREGTAFLVPRVIEGADGG